MTSSGGDRPTIAVVIPMHNKGPHIERALDAVFSQSRGPDEIIVVDDASTDDGAKRVLQLKDSRLRLIRRDTPGPGGYAARNAGVDSAASEWIAFLDADDSWSPNALEEAERLISLGDDNTSCVFLGYRYLFGDGSVRVAPFPAGLKTDHVRLRFSEFIDAWLETGQSPMWTCAVTARRETLQAIGGFPAGKCNRGGDKDTWIRLAAAGDALCGPAVVATYHRDSVNMVTKTTSVNVRPYLCQTLETMLADAAPPLARRLKRLINLEMAFHARHAWRERARVHRDVYKGFFVGTSPLEYVVLRLMSDAPESILRLTYLLREMKGGRRHRGIQPEQRSKA